MSIGKGINLSTGFDLNAQQPLDNRDVFETIKERDALPQINTYEGMKCYVKETKSNYQYIDGAWVSADVDNNSITYGITPPTSEDTLIWVDTSGNLSGTNYEDAFVEEVRESIFQATESLTDDIEGIKMKIGNLESIDVTYDGELKKIKEDISRIDSEISSIKTNISNILGNISVLKPNVNTLNTEVSTINAKIATVNKIIDDSNAKVETIEVNCSKIEKESIPNLVGQINLAKDRIGDIEEILTSPNEYIVFKSSNGDIYKLLTITKK
jgi:methyl-accepting chemotaxis protein